MSVMKRARASGEGLRRRSGDVLLELVREIGVGAP